MNMVVTWVEFWNRKVKQCTVWDVKLTQVYSMALILIVVKIFPQIMRLSIGWFVAIAVLCVPRLLYVFWLKNKGQPTAAPNLPKAASSTSG